MAYNQVRLHSGLRYLTQVAFTARLGEQVAACQVTGRTAAVRGAYASPRITARKGRKKQKPAVA